MTEQNIKRLHLIYGTVTAAVTVLVGIMMMVSCVIIYNGGAYTREIVAERFSVIAIPTYICLALVVGGFVLNIAYPIEKPKAKAKISTAALLLKTRKKADISSLPDATAQKIVTEQVKRTVMLCVMPVILVLSCVAFLSYALDPAHFPKISINDEVIRALYLLAACSALPFLYALFLSYAVESSRKKELALLKEATMIPAKKADILPLTEQKSQSRTVFAVKTAVFVCAVALLIYGLVSGGTADVIAKAVNICTECIGLG